MPEIAFRLDLVELLYEHRAGPLTLLFQILTLLGEIEGYVLVVACLHAAYDKGLAFRLAVLVLVTMSFNHVLKTLIANPRPFLHDGTYTEKWAVSAAKAEELVPEYSTPSGHAMAGASFYSYLFASVKRPTVRGAAIAAIVLTGISRPYLGVHYVEDVLLGWALGVPLALLAVKFGERFGRGWSALALPRRALVVGGASLATWLATSPLYAATPHGQPLPFLSYLGFLMGIVLAYPLEARWIDFDPSSSTVFIKALRALISVALVIGTLVALDAIFALLADDASLPGNLLRYLRYAAAGMAGMLGGPFLFTRLGLSRRNASARSRRPSDLQ